MHLLWEQEIGRSNRPTSNKSIMFFFYFILIYYILFINFYINPQKIFIFFRKNLDNSFFILDNNMFIKEYIYSCFFLSYLIYVPFIIFYILIIFNSISYNNGLLSYMMLIFIYMHFIAFIVNVLQFEIFFNNHNLFNLYSEGFDLSNTFFNIKGFFWDTMYGFIGFTFFCGRYYYFPSKIYKFIDSKNLTFDSTKSVNISIWILRLFFFIFFFYFFQGLPLFSGTANFIFFTLLVELIFFIFRFFFFLKII